MHDCGIFGREDSSFHFKNCKISRLLLSAMQNITAAAFCSAKFVVKLIDAISQRNDNLD